MSTDYRVKGRSNDNVRSLAKQLLNFFKADRRYPVNVLAFLKRNTIWTVYGIKRLVFKVLPDLEMGEDDARTHFLPGLVVIEAKTSVVDRAKLGVGRDRQTLAHELGHAVMHKGPTMSRGTGAVGNSTATYIKPYESAEHQAKVFGAAFLIIDEFAREMGSAAEISTHFGISLESATIYFEQLVDERTRPESVARVERMVEDFRNSARPSPPSPDYVDATCPNCRNRTLLSIGVKYLCDTEGCGYIGDLPDGD